MWQSREGSPDVAGLAHDLNNVFETIAEAAELLTGETDAAPLAATILRSVERGRRLVDGFADHHLAPVELETIIDRAAGFVRDLTRLLGLPDVRFANHLETGHKLPGPASEWERVFMNLFLNAAQAMNAGGEISVQVNPAPESLAITVSDEGPGIPAAILSQIFQPNFSTRRSHPGLGLHIVETIVHRQGGAISATNRTDRPGASFRIVVPAV